MSNQIRVSLNRIFVGNIPWTVGRLELKDYFSQFGKIAQATVVFNRETGMHQRYGFISFRDKADMETTLNHRKHQLEGNVLKVELQG